MQIFDDLEGIDLISYPFHSLQVLSLSPSCLSLMEDMVQARIVKVPTFQKIWLYHISPTVEIGWEQYCTAMVTPRGEVERIFFWTNSLVMGCSFRPVAGMEKQQQDEMELLHLTKLERSLHKFQPRDNVEWGKWEYPKRESDRNKIDRWFL